MDAADRNTLALATEDLAVDSCPRGPGDELDLAGDIYEQVQDILAWLFVLSRGRIGETVD